MGKIAILFPGQGAQYPGMGRELHEASAAARAVFELADRLRPGTSQQCFMGIAEELARTENTQPCLFCVDLAAAAALTEAGIQADMIAGFSLGELAALTYSGAADPEAGFRLVCRRGRLMQKSAEATEASMAAVLKLEDETVISLCGQFERVYPVNFNCPGQVVVAGEKCELERFKLCVKEKSGKVLPLKVGGAFHSPFMAQASLEFSEALRDAALAPPRVPLYSNVTGLPYAGNAQDLLARQICSPVRWRQTIEHMIASGADTFIEAGPGRVLTGLVTRISEQVRVFHVEDENSLRETVREVKTGA